MNFENSSSLLRNETLINNIFIIRKGIIISLSAIAAVFAINFILTHLFPNYVPMSLFLTAVVITAWSTGVRNGIIAAVIGALLEMFFFSSASTPFSHGAPQNLRLLIYLIQGVVLSYICGQFHSAQTKLVFREEQLNSALQREMNQRLLMQKTLDELQKSEVLLNQEREVARNANRIKSLFLAHMSHEIRTPLGAVLGFTELLKEPDLPPEKRLDYLNIIERTGNNLKDIINDILDISKVEAGRFEISTEHFSLRQVLNEVYSVMSLKCKEKNITLSIIQIGYVPDWICADDKRIRQILLNLIGNAVKFTNNGSVKATYRQENGMLIFQIIDEGIGITDDQKERLFENFNQGDNSVCRQYGGTGLGLALSKKLALMMGGDITLLSSEVNKGSVFAFSTQFEVSGDADVATLNTSLDLDTEKLKNKKVLIVDDSLDNRFLLENYLLRVGLEVFTASNGAEALDKMEKQSFDIVFMDMQMPVMDGYTATEKLREKDQSTAVVAVTADAMTSAKRRCLQSGCNGYISKPLLRDDVYRALNNFCH